MRFEKTVDNAVNGFVMWVLQFEIIINIICAVICFVTGYRFLKKDKKNAGYIWCGTGGIIVLLDVVKAFF